MRLLSWNCQGAGKALAVRALKALVCENSPNIVFLFETKSDVKKIEKIRLSRNFVDCFYVEAFGKSWRFGFVLEKRVDLGGVWILYLKVISRIFMHRMHSAKSLRCLVGILENAKCIL